MRYQHVKPSTLHEDKLLVTTIPCPSCSGIKIFTVSIVGFQGANNGTLIQRAFPEMSNDDRERLISGYCGDCWDELFADDDQPND